MGFSIITDGSGSGHKVEVDKNNRLHSQSVAASIQEQSATTGDTYNLNTKSVTLTSDSESALVYLKNNGENDLHVASVGFLVGNSTGGAGDMNIKVLRNPTAGSVVTNAVPMPILINKNFGSFNTLDSDAFLGGEGETLTDGEEAYNSLLAGSARTYVIATGTLAIPKGSSLGITVTPQVGNTNMDIQVFMALVNYNL
jgi:hypothetical protein